jgi:Domain of unknown function (DUF222)
MTVRGKQCPSCANPLVIERMYEYNEGVLDSPLAHAHRLLTEAVDTLAAAAGSGAGDDELLSALTLCEATARRLDRVTVAALADLERRGVFTERGYRSTVTALGDLLGWERFDARRKLVAAEHIRPRTALDGTVLPPRLPATAAAFEDGAASLRHFEVVARVLDTPAAGRLDPAVWADAETLIAGHVHLVHGLPEFYPPPWIDPDRRPRRRPPPVMVPAN